MSTVEADRSGIIYIGNSDTGLCPVIGKYLDDAYKDKFVMQCDVEPEELAKYDSLGAALDDGAIRIFYRPNLPDSYFPAYIYHKGEITKQ